MGIVINLCTNLRCLKMFKVGYQKGKTCLECRGGSCYWIKFESPKTVYSMYKDNIETVIWVSKGPDRRFTLFINF